MGDDEDMDEGEEPQQLSDEDMDEDEEPQELTDDDVRAALHELGLMRQAPRVRPKTDWTVQELYATDLPEPKWIVPQLLPDHRTADAGPGR